MKNSFKFILVTGIALFVGTTGVALAQEVTPTVVPTVTDIQGTVVAVDEEAGTVDILQEDGTIVTVALPEGDYEHPVTALLADYFGGAGLDDYATALDDLEMNGSVVVAVDENTVEGNTTWEVTLADGNVVTLEDAEEAQTLIDALEVTTVDLSVTEEDGVMTAEDVGAQIEEYRDMGIGYGELVKIYAIAAESQEACMAEDDAAADAGIEDTNVATEGDAVVEPEEPCGVTVEELANMLLDGTGMGQLFKLYGKPALLGVGHVRQALNAGEDGEGKGGKGVCNARSHGGNANANGQDIDCP